MADLVATCASENVQADGTCGVIVWSQMPQPLLPSLTAAEGAELAFAIGSVWALGLAVRIFNVTRKL